MWGGDGLQMMRKRKEEMYFLTKIDSKIGQITKKKKQNKNKQNKTKQNRTNQHDLNRQLNTNQQLSTNVNLTSFPSMSTRGT
jgi:hypothetical protein